MTGTEILNLTASILGDENIDQTTGLQMLNTIRTYIEGRRPWQVLKKKDSSETVNGSNTFLTAHTMPSDLMRYLGNGTIQLYDGTNIPQECEEIPYEDLLLFKNEPFKFAADYGSRQFYITGEVPGTFTVWQWYIFDPGDITATSEWLRFPERFHPLLAFELAAMWRLGTDWDDVNARNADDNALRANLMYKAMEAWDNELALSQVKNLEYPQHMRGRGTREPFGPRGTRRM